MFGKKTRKVQICLYPEQKKRLDALLFTYDLQPSELVSLIIRWIKTTGKQLRDPVLSETDFWQTDIHLRGPIVDMLTELERKLGLGLPEIFRRALMHPDVKQLETLVRKIYGRRTVDI